MKNLLKVIYFWIFNWVFVPSSKQITVLNGLRENNESKSQKWFFIAVILNLAPFLLASLLEWYLHIDNFKCFLNNGSLPILSFGIIATNFFYLIENIPENSNQDKELYQNMKLKVSVVAIISLFISTILYVFQSNFILLFLPEHYNISIYISLIVFCYAVSCGRKMFLLQNSFLIDYAASVNDIQEKLEEHDDEFEQ
ncbi:hypothetical protein VB796_12420 [Arcicella sp. LKC2W]|uniref:hypothetical protein n=1 Tax=Arcicella sp. LKC2W TaxID=2984198 RepID=UPI002B203D50|nr:hypothetical protein [Arcicella sp. LKC2W]MEA5459851.1 hypothetical protein [Arcicella sp. LKC2W]